MTGLVETPNVQRLLWTKLFVFQIKTPSKVYLDFGSQSLQAPFYRTVWFVVLLAAASIVIIIMVVAILCVKAKTYKYKGKNVNNSVTKTHIVYYISKTKCQHFSIQSIKRKFCITVEDKS